MELTPLNSTLLFEWGERARAQLEISLQFGTGTTMQSPRSLFGSKIVSKATKDGLKKKHSLGYSGLFGVVDVHKKLLYVVENVCTRKHFCPLCAHIPRNHEATVEVSQRQPLFIPISLKN
jgi:hypothetical protein